MGNLQSDVRYTVRWRWLEYNDADGEAHTYGWWERTWQTQTQRQSAWYERGVMRSIGNGLTGFANDVTLGLPDQIDRWMGREPTADADSSAYQTGAWIGFAAGLLLPGPGKLAPLRHAKLIKNIVRNASKRGVALSDAKIAQLGRVVQRAGGTVRTEVGRQGSVNGVLHSHVIGFGSRVGHRHIIHLNQVP